MAETMCLERGRDGIVDLSLVTRRGGEEQRIRHAQSQPLARVPLLDWPADLFARGAAMVETIAEDYSAAWHRQSHAGRARVVRRASGPFSVRRA